MGMSLELGMRLGKGPAERRNVDGYGAKYGAANEIELDYTNGDGEGVERG